MGSDSSGAALDNLYPALSECFAIIICGYFAGRANLISETEAKGINTFVGTFSLPSLIFMSLAELDLHAVNWLFLFSILVAKSVVFFTVIFIVLLVRRPLNYGRAGIFAIFCTQSNDFAIGYPIVAALYKNSHPEYASYLYLMAPISLAILNPIGFVLMEIEKRKINPQEVASINGESSEARSVNKERIKFVGSIFKNIFSNPVVMMTMMGILGNFVFKHNVPAFLGGILKVLGSAFSASALFLLGLRMVGKVHKLRGALLVVPGILIIVKLLMLPLVTREVVSLIHAGGNVSETVDLSTYGFLYGTFPSAPTVFVFATQYLVDVDLIASAMVACTFISAPLMFVSAKMITMTKTDPADYIKQLDTFTFDISIAGIVACSWVIVVLILTKKIMRVPHKITACLVISQFLSCLGAILWNTLNHKEGWAGYIQFSIFTVGIYSSRLWTAFLAVSLLFLQCRSLCFVLKLLPIFIIFGWCVPVLLSIVLLLFDANNSLPYDKRNPNFIYGTAQAAIAVSLLTLCLTITVGCLILHQRYRKRFNRYLGLAQEVASSFDRSETEINSPIGEEQSSSSTNAVNTRQLNHKCGSLPTIKEKYREDSLQSSVTDIEDLLPNSFVPIANDDSDPLMNNICPSHFGCQGPQREQCHGIVQKYQEQVNEDVELIEEEPEEHDPQVLRHIVLLILLICSMFVGLALCIWTLIMEQLSGIYIELSFLDAALNFGQSIIVFAVFGTNTKEISLPILKCWRKLRYGANTLNLQPWQDLNSETKHICEQFVTHHLARCKAAVAEDKRWRMKTYRGVFAGNKLVDWLIEVGLARDRTEAVNYARHLLEGKVLQHINSLYHFYDRNLLYLFN